MHRGTCVISPVWRKVEAAVTEVLAGVQLSDLLLARVDGVEAPVVASAAEASGGGGSWPAK